jgi:hypothetical protein
VPPVYQVVNAPPNTSLADLNTAIAQTEPAGPLVKMGNDGRQTVLTFDFAQTGPTKFAVIQKSTDPAPANSTKLFSGSLFVASALADYTAYRPN